MTFNFNNFWDFETQEHAQVVKDSFETLQEDFNAIINICETAIKNGNKILFFGNGGSAADAQHLATELAVRYKNDRAPIAGLALTTDTSALTACGNDFGFDYIFSRQIQALGKPGDIAIAISTSGNSANVIKAIEQCKAQNITSIGFTGKTGGKMSNECDYILKIPSTTTARIQEMHITFGQMLCGALELKLGLVED